MQQETENTTTETSVVESVETPETPEENAEFSTFIEEVIVDDAGDGDESPAVDEAPDDKVEEKTEDPEVTVEDAADEPAEESKPEEAPKEEEPGAEDTKAGKEAKEPAEAAKKEEGSTPVLPTEQKPPALTPEEFQKQRDEWMEASVDKLAKEHFDNEALQEVFGEEQAGHIARLQAQTFMLAAETLPQIILQHLPNAIQQINTQQKEQQDLETAFFAEWPELDKGNEEHAKTIHRLATAYRNAHPSMDAETFRRDVGIQAMVALKIDRKQQPAPAPVVAPPTPGVAGGRPGGQEPTESNYFAQLAEEAWDD